MRPAVILAGLLSATCGSSTVKTAPESRLLPSQAVQLALSEREDALLACREHDGRLTFSAAIGEDGRPEQLRVVSRQGLDDAEEACLLGVVGDLSVAAPAGSQVELYAVRLRSRGVAHAPAAPSRLPRQVGVGTVDTSDCVQLAQARGVRPGRVVLTWSIDAEGRPFSLSLLKDTVRDAGFSACLRRTVLAQLFEEGQGTVEVEQYPVLLPRS